MLLTAARELDMMVVPEGSGDYQDNMTMIIDGNTGIEHAVALANMYQDTTQLWSQTKSGYTPTLGVAYGGLAGENYWYQTTEVWKNQKLMSFVPNYIVKPNAIRPSKAPLEHYNHVYAAETAKKLRDAGVSVQLGAHGQREGLASHWEMWMLSQGGFTPWQAIRAATIDGANYLGMDKQLGSIEVGKLADLMIVDGEPLTNIRDSEKVIYTVLNGRIYDSATMNQVGHYPQQREKLYFNNNYATPMHPATTKYIQTKAETYHWNH